MAVNSITANEKKKLAHNRSDTIIEDAFSLANFKTGPKLITFEERSDFTNSEHGDGNSKKNTTEKDNAKLEKKASVK